MNDKTTRILKEARALFWPWCGVVIAGGVLPLLLRLHSMDWVAAAFFGGIPLLATLSLGNEFQHRTLSLLLIQPVSRMEIWGEKLSVTTVAVLSAALIFYYGARPELQQYPELWAVAGVSVITATCSATFWTLLARSTMGGLALTLFLQSFMIQAGAHLEGIRGTGYLSRANISVVSIAALCYAGVMLWLGRRTLARFQVTGGMAGADLMMAGPDVMPEALAGWFRCRPTGAVLNLIRKELRLLRPIWLITLLAVVGWTCLTMSGLVPERGSTKNLTSPVAFAIAMSVISALILPVLAGSLSLGEERTSGTHSWHMTLPVSTRRQWLVKRAMALFAGFACAVLLPFSVLIAGGFLIGSPLMFVDVHDGMNWLLIVSLLTFASFWCACAVNGTVRAVLWVFPALGALSIAGQFGGWVAEQLTPRVVSRIDFFSDFRFINSVSKLPFNIFLIERILPRGDYYLVATFFLVPVLVLAVVQSYRLFRSQPQYSIMSLIRNLLPLTTLAFLLCFSFVAFYTLVNHARHQTGRLLYETHHAIEKIQPSTPNLDATHPLELTVEDLAKASHLSDTTRRGLRGSRISLAPGRACCPDRVKPWFDFFKGQKVYVLYTATIHLASGSKCALFFYDGELSHSADGGCE